MSSLQNREGYKPVKVFLGMSGGVDSAVAAALLLRQGYEVIGVTLLLKADAEPDSREVLDAASVAKSLGIRHYSYDCRELFRREVEDYFVEEYLSGKTPNPCVKCNPTVKIKALCEFADMHGGGRLATGHYAKLGLRNGEYSIFMHKSKKDQSYFLQRLTAAQVSRLIFPLSELDKSEVRAEAQRLGFSVASKSDSQDICFIPEADHTAFIKSRSDIVCPEGDFVDMQGRPLGRHKGIIHYTTGQRRGLGIAYSEPLYVRRIDTESNKIYLCTSQERFDMSLCAERVNWIIPPLSNDSFYALVKVRSAATPAKALVKIISQDKIKIEFCSPQLSVTAGQSAAIYDGECLLGGGIII